jgi:hypothetical protein
MKSDPRTLRVLDRRALRSTGLMWRFLPQPDAFGRTKQREPSTVVRLKLAVHSPEAFWKTLSFFRRLRRCGAGGGDRTRDVQLGNMSVDCK